jgi:hypothetical protein
MFCGLPASGLCDTDHGMLVSAPQNKEIVMVFIEYKIVSGLCDTDHGDGR